MISQAAKRPVTSLNQRFLGRPLPRELGVGDSLPEAALSLRSRHSSASPFLAPPVLAFRGGELTAAPSGSCEMPSCEGLRMRGARIEVHDPGLKIKVGHRGNPGQTDTWPPVSGIFSQSLGLRGAPVLCVPTALLWLSLFHPDDALTRHSGASWSCVCNAAGAGQIL